MIQHIMVFSLSHPVTISSGLSSLSRFKPRDREGQDGPASVGTPPPPPPDYCFTFVIITDVIQEIVTYQFVFDLCNTKSYSNSRNHNKKGLRSYIWRQTVQFVDLEIFVDSANFSLRGLYSHDMRDFITYQHDQSMMSIV